MENLIACLGFNPHNEGIIFPILEARLNDSIDLCRANPQSLLLLMGGYALRNRTPASLDPSVLMKQYIETQAPDILETTDIILHSEASTTIRELCFIRQFIDRRKTDFRLTIVASEFFVERVKLWAEYILHPHEEEISFVASAIPFENRTFQAIEKYKLELNIELLKGYEKGDYEAILADQPALEQKILNNEILLPATV